MPKEDKVRKIKYLNYHPKKKQWYTRFPFPEELWMYAKQRTKFINASSAIAIEEQHEKNLAAFRAEMEHYKKKSVQIQADVEHTINSADTERLSKRRRRMGHVITKNRADIVKEEIKKCATSCTIPDHDLKQWILDWYETYFKQAEIRLEEIFHYKQRVDEEEEGYEDIYWNQLCDLRQELHMLNYRVDVFQPHNELAVKKLDQDAFNEILLKHKINLESDSIPYLKATRLIKGIMIDVLTWQLDCLYKEDKSKFLSHSLDEVKDLKDGVPQIAPYSTNQFPLAESNLTVTQLFDKFKEHKTKRDNPGQSYWDRWVYMRDLAKEQFKSKALSILSKEDFDDLRDNISSLPKRKPNDDLGDLSYLRRIKLSKRNNLERPNNDSANKLLRNTREVFQYAEDEGYIRHGISSVLAVKFNDRNRKGNISQEKERHAYTDLELKKIFSFPLFVGSSGKRGNLNEEGKVISWNKDYWGPLITLFTGMRPKEIWQMRISQIKDEIIDNNVGVDNSTEETIKYFHVVSEYDEQKIKTGRLGFRKVPIHPMLKELGFEEYIKDRKEDDYVIHDMKRSKAQNKTRFFTRYFLEVVLKELDLKSSEYLKDFYSLRHNFASRADEVGLSDREIYALCGWVFDEKANLSQSMIKRYTQSAYDLKRNKASIDQINYPSINFEPMLYKNLKPVGWFKFET